MAWITWCSLTPALSPALSHLRSFTRALILAVSPPDFERPGQDPRLNGSLYLSRAMVVVQVPADADRLCLAYRSTMRFVVGRYVHTPTRCV
jgi:hypothetical protein